MTGKRERLLQASALLGAAGAGVALAAGPAVADTGALQATPTTRLHDGQSLSVYWDTGLSWGTTGISAAAAECSGPVPSGPIVSTLVQCDGLTVTNLEPVRASDGDLAFQGNIIVRKSLDPLSGAVTCTNQCSIVVGYFGNGLGVSSGSVPIAFK